MDVCCVLSGRGLCDGLDHSSRGVLKSVVFLSVIMNADNEEVLAHWGAIAPWGGWGEERNEINEIIQKNW